MSNFLISPLVSQQLPDFVRSEYSTFVTFLEKYYEWMEKNGNVVDELNKIKYSQDVDLASDFYVTEIKNDFLPYFPEVVNLDKSKFIKLANQFYKSKGTAKSLKFLFKALFNEDIEIYYPQDDILKVSDGKWTLPLALRIETSDNNVFNIEKTVITGLTSKATALVEKVTKSVDRQLGITYIEIYISNVQKIFATGETLTATYNNGTTDVTVTARLIGSLSEIKIDPAHRGLYYNAYDPVSGYSGDPVTIIGGLNSSSNTPVGAIAYVGETTTGGIPDITVFDGGFGFRNPYVYANTSIVDFTGGFPNTLGTEARAQISLLDEDVVRTIKVSNTSISTIVSVPIANVENNAISSISTFESFDVYPISFITVLGQGGGYSTRPDVDVYSFYREKNTDDFVTTTSLVKDRNYITSSTVDFTSYFDAGDFVRLFLFNRYEEIFEVFSVTPTQLTFYTPIKNNASGVSVYKLNRNDLRKLGSLGRIKIDIPGENYSNGDVLVFTGGSGYGANGYVTVNSTGSIIDVAINAHSSNAYAIGGEGYSKTDLPTITINTATGANASLRVLEILGDGESLNLSTTKVGAISKLRVISYGYDYTSAPTISLRNADLTVANVPSGQLFVANTIVYQGTSNTNTTFTARVDRFYSANNFLRIFDYVGTLNVAQQLISDDNTISANVVSVSYYGDGLAQATASFENGLIRLPGLYINSDGHVSSDKKIQDAEKYHGFSYVINTQQDYYKFKNTLNDLAHPLGTKTFINRIDNNIDTIPVVVQSNNNIEVLMSDTFNISNGSNNMVCTNTSANVASTVNVGDIVILTGLSRKIPGTVNTNSGSNTVTGVSTNFINDLLEGERIYLSTGNTDTVANIVSANSFVTTNTINVTSLGTTINLLFNDTKVVTFVNANTILVDTVFTTNSNFISTYIEKVK